ncbi:hypothetical protein [Actinophytocola sp.]|nr:hypothetical protein [Actinophytocola sp.]
MRPPIGTTPTYAPSPATVIDEYKRFLFGANQLFVLAHATS